MVSLDWRVDSRDSVALVELTVTNSTDAARRVRIANRLDGSVWPPRREGVPEAGWDDGGFEGVVAPGERRALGYASPVPVADASAADVSSADAPVADPPAEIVWTERAGESVRGESASAATIASTVESGVVSDVESTSEVVSTPEGVVRALGDARPPADAVPRPVVEDDPDDSSSRRSP